MLTPDDLRGIADELRCNAEALHDGHTLRGEWHDDDAKREHDKLLAWADALVAVHAGPIKSHEAIDWSRPAAEISADYLAVVRERDALRTKLREADSLRCLADIRAAVGDSGQMTQSELVECIKRLWAALATAREWIAAERQSQAECVTLPDGSIDACERAALADIDAVLSEIDAAMAKESIE